MAKRTGGVTKPKPTYLKVSIALDMSQEVDRKLNEFVEDLPFGLRANVLRRLIMQGLPSSESELQQLLGRTAMDARVRNQRPGRPRRTPVIDGPNAGAAAPAARDAEAPMTATNPAPVTVEAEPTAQFEPSAAALPMAAGSVDEANGSGNETALPVAEVTDSPDSVPARKADVVVEPPAQSTRKRVQIGGLVSWQT
ncbi:hypothetical protein [Burkholderia vietnamiensis]|uniref:hypothetical protein n=1 Tax=Burkholderia vietnamiensis TaxID=60552 RepID=UPI001D157CD8|nr:hypothetical protein [Burkholderia vietnamiensis]UEC05547.1 hypothetical protein LK462_34490 [Burkholderia vietnamiensis]